MPILGFSAETIGELRQMFYFSVSQFLCVQKLGKTAAVCICIQDLDKIF